jgi:hypothetical protein
MRVNYGLNPRFDVLRCELKDEEPIKIRIK